MSKVNINKFKKHQKLISDSIAPNEQAVLDGYGIHDSLITWAMVRISTKELTKLIKESK